MNKIAILQNRIQEYAWGSKTFIPELLGEPSPAETPQAELWMGSHPKAPSQAIINGDRISLADMINRDPKGTLGSSIERKFSNNLPFLFKVLAAARPLSIQAHPDKEQAKEGFNGENLKGIDLNAPNRNYRDENHKPELICALQQLWALKGFRRIEDIIKLMDKIGVFTKELGIDILRNQPNKEGLKRFFISLMTMERNGRSLVIEGIIDRLKGSDLSEPAFDWVRRLNQEYPGDIGVLSPLFLNVILLQPTEGMYIPSGELHAYLEGSGLELMANSDNVLRGGLTPKHVDLPELIRVLNFTPQDPDILRPEGKGKLEAFYSVTAEEFVLSVISLHKEDLIYESPGTRSAEIMICTEGDARVKDNDNGDVLKVNSGMSIFIPASVKRYQIQGEATIYKASVPL
ncbi:mannose-6-phosphate isomerase, class I [Thermodesulfobacteriota bacterium]